MSDLDTLLQGRRKLILLDDNLLAHPAALNLLDEMARRNLAVNFNQTPDLRRLTPESAALLRRIRCSNVGFTRPNYYFSLNDARGLLRFRSQGPNVCEEEHCPQAARTYSRSHAL